MNNSDKQKVIGIDLGGTNVRAGIVDGSSVKKILSCKVDKDGSAENVLENIFSVVDPIFNKEICGIGTGVPSILDVERGIVYDVQNIPSWKEVPLKEIMEDRYKVPVYINNDANCFATGEKFFGKAKGYKNAACVTLGTGIGVGLIINGSLYSGRNCGAGEFGTIPYKDHTYEYYCSGMFFKNIYGIPGDALYNKALSGDEQSVKAFEEFGFELGNSVNLVLYSIDPEIIIFGGSISKAFPLFKKALMESVGRFEFKRSLTNLKIEVSGLDNSPILGAAALFFENKNSIA